MATVEAETRTKDKTVLARIAKMGNIEVVAIASLHFDKSYQRDLRSHFVQKLAQNWEQTAMQLPIVSRRANGTLYVVNGQHRIAAATLLGMTEITALVVEGLNPKDEAELRLVTNVTLGETALERFHAKVAAQQPEALELVEITKRFDTQINMTPTKHGGINSVTVMEDLYAEDKGITLVRVFELIRDAFGSVGGEYATANMLKAIAWFLHAHDGEFNRDRLVEQLKSIGPSALDRMMRNQRAAMGGAQWLNQYRALVEVYNERLSDANRLEWRTTGWSSKKSTGGWN